jgi:adenine/guanine phosphoribosyltransferase-like PRPP-binding protein
MPTADYLQKFFQNPAEVVAWVADELKPHLGEFDAIAFRGMSGAMVAPAVAMQLGVPFVLVRKKGDGSHSSCEVEALWTTGLRYVIVDDLVSSGTTVHAIQDQLAESGAVCVGISLWYNQATHWRADLEKSRKAGHYACRYFRGFSFIAPPVSEGWSPFGGWEVSKYKSPAAFEQLTKPGEYAFPMS